MALPVIGHIFIAVSIWWMLVHLAGSEAQDTIWIADTDGTAEPESSASPNNSSRISQQDESRRSCDCGKRARLVSRIVGGRSADIQEYPWMVAITSEGLMFCGGALVSLSFILTASHCFKPFTNRRGQPDSSIAVRLGITSRFETGGYYRIKDIIIHENYNRRVPGVNDIALIELAQPVQPSAKIQPICLPAPSDVFTNKYGTVAGWGVLTHGGWPSNTLQAVALRILSFDECQKALGKYKKTVNSNCLCAGGEKGKDACQGDSGSPLFVEDNGVFKVVGIVSWGLKCAKANIPGVYTNVALFVPWIRSHATQLCS